MYSYKKIIDKLIKSNTSVSVAESCTGGQLSKLFTDIPGVSKIFNMGLITYSNKSKTKILKIPSQIIKKYGSVSTEVASIMCLNLHKISGSKLCISTTGIAGPNGATKKKPIGLVFIGIKYKKKLIVIKKIFNGNRKKIQINTVKTAIKEINNLI